jgi:hypothetical protein
VRCASNEVRPHGAIGNKVAISLTGSSLNSRLNSLLRIPVLGHPRTASRPHFQPFQGIDLRQSDGPFGLLYSTPKPGKFIGNWERQYVPQY